MQQISLDTSAQIDDTRAIDTPIAHTLNESGYSPEAVAEGLLEGAFFALANDRNSFLTVLVRFKKTNVF